MTPPALIQRLIAAVNQHDLDALTACFAPDFVSDSPAHPDRTFRGHEQMRANWSQIFHAVPDVALAMPHWAAAGDTIWAEQEFTGTRRDGGPHLMRGVTIFGVRNDRVASVRFYVEPVQADGVQIGAAVRETVAGPASRP